MRIVDLAFHGIAELEADWLESSKQSTATLVVGPDRAATDVAADAAERGSCLILVVNDAEQILGVVAPDWVIGQVSRVEGADAADMQSAVDYLEAHPKAVDEYGHEWLNAARPELFKCQEGRHLVDRCPCRYHPESACV